jgi:hypothetical protein
LSTKGFRLSSTSTNFEVKTGEPYSFKAGFRYYAKAATKATTVVDSTLLSFQFEGASSTLLGLGALATSVLVSMF